MAGQADSLESIFFALIADTAFAAAWGVAAAVRNSGAHTCLFFEPDVKD